MKLALIYVELLIAIGSLLSTDHLWAQDSDSSVVDLGQVSVTGEVRRPAISWIDSQKAAREAVPGLLKSEFEKYEENLLKASSIDSIESEKDHE
jgi:hypothetical protein